MTNTLGGEDLELESGGEALHCRVHRAANPSAGIVWVFGAGGGLGGPADGLYERLASLFQPDRVASLQVAYRQPGRFESCVDDTLAGAQFLHSIGAPRVVLVGHSFGGAVAIEAGAASPLVMAVAALSSQSYRTEAVSRLSPRPLMLMHGQADEVLPADCSRDIFRRAGEPKQLRLYPRCRHGLDQCRDEIDRDLTAWLREVVRGGPGGGWKS